ncbi:MAG: YgiQ family radical SAM protein [Sphaerochaetaceae bacterium]|nr:YgiQ family radical SAM protein [Sphaerochaetaceae bacterium]
MNRNLFLPTTKEDMLNRGWDYVDVVMISGDAYVDHPSFGVPLLARLLESRGYRVGIIAQPRWDRVDDFLVFGNPRLCCMIGSGNIDSMVSHYTSANKRRSNDYYTPGGKAGARPDRAAIVYTTKAKEAFDKNVPIIIGGIEPSLRKFAHYDVWSDKVRHSIILDSKADLVIYGMGELQTLEIVKRLDDGETIDQIIDVKGTLVSFSQKKFEEIKHKINYPIFELPSFEEVSERDKKSNSPTENGKLNYAKAFQIQMLHENPKRCECLIQKSENRVVLRNPIQRGLTTKEMDELYELPFTRVAHIDYDKFGGISALTEVQFSITSNRGCYGGCSFCAITTHQGRMIQTRSKESLVREATLLTKMPNFKGYIHDLGGPTANFQAVACDKQLKSGPCDTKQCLFPEPCKNLKDSHQRYLEILEAIEKVKGVKKVFIRSGIRFDYLMEVADPKTRDRFLKHLVLNNVSGQLKIAPEHVDPAVLDIMGKPKVEVYNKFIKAFKDTNEKLNKKQYTIPYFIAAHPGSTLESAINLALHSKSVGFVPDQGQEFYPTPATVSTCMYYTGYDPRPNRNFAKVYVPKGREKRLQRAILQFDKIENRTLVREALTKANRLDLINVLKPSGKAFMYKNRKNIQKKVYKSH